MKIFAVFALLLLLSLALSLVMDNVIHIGLPMSIRNSLSFLWFMRAPETIILAGFGSIPMLLALFRYVQRRRLQ
ncbi:hypothetical protein PaecuDRAFT_0018 [Paenibacillus curdlanolyticus YK9]|uniref:Uncharacterized protein n=1 Tax=Paenibacillus curdlanolyticus YK9 TaxID=717606 RepID=E0I4H6_9BACL|nr:hypothetical protein PaecuDRAFT_0018 [Paenibacillus curdlanolyticus YK9]